MAQEEIKMLVSGKELRFNIALEKSIVSYMRLKLGVSFYDYIDQEEAQEAIEAILHSDDPNLEIVEGRRLEYTFRENAVIVSGWAILRA